MKTELNYNELLDLIEYNEELELLKKNIENQVN